LNQQCGWAKKKIVELQLESNEQQLEAASQVEESVRITINSFSEAMLA